MRYVLFLLALMLCPMTAHAQGAIQQLGTVTQGHLGMFVRNGQMMDAGGPVVAGGAPTNNVLAGTRPSGLGFVNSGQSLALWSGYASSAYSEFLAGYDGAGNMLFTLHSVGGGPTPGCNWNINGVFYACASAGGGNVVGPASTVIGDVACWNNTHGGLLSDCGSAFVQAGGVTVVNDVACWNSTNGTLLTDCGNAYVKGPVSATVGHVPAFNNTTGNLIADPAGSAATRLTNRSGNYITSPNYGGSSASAGLIEVLGSSGTPDATQDAVAIFQKWSNSTTNYNAGINPAVYITNILQSGADTSRGTALHVEGLLNVPAATINNFVEGIRTHGSIAAGMAGGSAYGIVSAAAEGAGATHFGYLVGSESEVDNNSADATYSFGTGNSTLNHFEAAYLATSRGSKKPFAAFMVNAFTAASTSWQVGFYVPAASPNVSLAPVAGAAFRSDAPSTWGIDLTGHGAGPTFAALGSANNIPSVRGTLADGSQNPILLLLDGSNILHLGGDDLPLRIDIGTAAVPTRVMKYLDFLATTAPAQPVAGNMRVYMDVADGKLKAIGQAGTVTTIANP